MKTRIISGVVMAIMVASVLFLGLNVKYGSYIILGFLVIVSAIGVYELVTNAAKIRNMILRVLSAVYAGAMTFFISSWLVSLIKVFGKETDGIELNYDEVFTYPLVAIILSVIYFIGCAVFILARQEEFDLAKISTLCAMPLFYAFGFSTLGSIIVATGGIYYLLLILNFACVCDMGAYFVGVKFGKTKLCPAISPKKTVEGAIGGIVSSVLVSLIILLVFKRYDKMFATLLLTVPLCVAGMAGDLFASVIKRKTDIKDYGNLIPGHGGVLDRVDSILFTSPLVICLLMLGVI